MTSDTESQAEQCRRSITMLDVQVLAAIDRRDWTSADRLDRQRNKLRRMLAGYHASRGEVAKAAQLRKDAAS